MVCLVTGNGLSPEGDNAASKISGETHGFVFLINMLENEFVKLLTERKWPAEISEL